MARAVVLKYTPTLRFLMDDSVLRGNKVLQIIEDLDQSTPAIAQRAARDSDAVLKKHIIAAANCLNRPAVVVELAATEHQPASSGSFQKRLINKATAIGIYHRAVGSGTDDQRIGAGSGVDYTG